LASNLDIDLVTLDGKVPETKDSKPELTARLVVKIRALYAGPIIAASSDDCFTKILMSAGCTCGCNKALLPDKIREVIGL
jgi:hypothetical protein